MFFYVVDTCNVSRHTRPYCTRVPHVLRTSYWPIPQSNPQSNPIQSQSNPSAVVWQKLPFRFWISLVHRTPPGTIHKFCPTAILFLPPSRFFVSLPPHLSNPCILVATKINQTIHPSRPPRVPGLPIRRCQCNGSCLSHFTGWPYVYGV